MKMTKLPDEILALLPNELSEVFSRCENRVISQITEIRLRANKPVMVTLSGGDLFLLKDGTFSTVPRGAYLTGPDEVERLFSTLSSHSLYAHEEELKEGYLTLPHGHRVGFAGRFVAEEGRIRSFAGCASINIRLAKQIKGCADGVMPYLTRDGRVLSTLIISPPMLGKTTLLRDMARQISDGIFGAGGKRVCIVDERCEIAACEKGVPQLDVGLRTDVLDGCPKSIGIMMALRTLSPQVLITDELGGKPDADAVLEAIHCGVKVIATVHGNHMEDVNKRGSIAKLMEEGAFSRYIVLSGRPGRIHGIYDEQFKPLKRGGQG
ncbi:MAG: stage III sporulation protein AA [Clostridiales bacterium]|nr:stage III sporulation protein AA [Clostridiales bacterium]